MGNRVRLTRRGGWIGGVAIVGVLAALASVVGLASANSSLRLRAIAWRNVTLPGRVCRSGWPIRLHDHVARIAHTRFGDVHSFGSNPDLVLVWAAYRVTYGRLGALGPAAAVDVLCSNNGGTADGQLRFADVVFSGSGARLRAVGLITPQQPRDSDVPHVPLLTYVRWVRGRIIAKEAWYGPNDGTCCASGRATTTWAYRGGRLKAVRTVVTKQPRG